MLAWRKLGSFRGDSAFGGWLYWIATYVVLTYLHKQKYFLNAVDIDDLPELGALEDSALQMSLEESIVALPDGARIVFVLYSIEGYIHEEVGKELGIAVGSSKAQLRRARQLLKRQLGNDPEVTHE